jgi:hypothetical protein
MYTYFKVSLEEEKFAVVKTFVDPVSSVRYGDIVDVECCPHDREALARLAGKAIACLRSEGAAIITTWATPGSPVRSVVESLGFRECTHETYFGLKSLDRKHDYLRDFDKWYLQQADATNY